ncbi:MAG: alpha/beta hydrolase [Chitinophagaceae bacterium]
MLKPVIAFGLLLCCVIANAQQKVVLLYKGTPPGSEKWTYSEKTYQPGTANELVYNVSVPTLTVFPPDPSVPPTGTAVIVCPGGGFYILAIKHEGTDVATWLSKKGITVFVLKYRLGQSLTEEPGKELGDNMKKSDFVSKVTPIIPLCIADGKAAIKYVRAHAAEYHIATDRIGIIGFSAGGTVTAASAFNYTAEDRPDFVAPIYGYIPPVVMGSVPADAPPVFLAAATDDGLNLASHSVDMYSKWLAAKKPVEMHLYQSGNHGFGMHQQNIPTDTWIERYGDWLGLLGLLKAK